MHDFFAILGAPRRPWLDADELKQRYHQLSTRAHPDLQQQQESASEINLALLNEAYAALQDHRLRLLHLLGLEHPELAAQPASSIIPPDLADFFMEISALTRAADTFLQKKREAASALAAALLAPEAMELTERLQQLDAILFSKEQETEEQLRGLDACWEQSPGDTGQQLLELSRRFSYIARWRGQLRERLSHLLI